MYESGTLTFLECSRCEPPPRGRRTTSVTVRFDLSASGQAIDPMVTTAANPMAPALTSHALEVARSCRYRPARRDGEAVAVRGLQRVFYFAF